MKEAQNPLYPVFLKLHELKLLIVGGGAVGYEKLFFILKSSPLARIRLVAPEINPQITDLLAGLDKHFVEIEQRHFHVEDVNGVDLVIAATNLPVLNLSVRRAARAAGKLVNVADTPELCDFYLGAIVTRGPLKVGISTNGQSPTFAKRFRELLEESLPAEGDVAELLNALQALRQRLGGDFESRVRELNSITAHLLDHDPATTAH